MADKQRGSVRPRRVSKTTNNRMEITAAIKGAGSAHRKARSVTTPLATAEYLVNTMTQGTGSATSITDLWETPGRPGSQSSTRSPGSGCKRPRRAIPSNEFVNALAEFEAGVRGQRPSQDRFQPAPVEDAEPADSDEPRLTHLDEEGRASMVDVGWKPETVREAVARGYRCPCSRRQWRSS